MTETTGRRALISGASIAGPALGYWLTRHGWTVTLVERAAHVRGGGYPIDLRGTAVEVAKRMEIYDDARRARVGPRSEQMLNQKGRCIARLDLSADLLNNEDTGDVELPRGELAQILYEKTRDQVDYVFSDSVATIAAHADRVDVTFVSGGSDSFDVVIGADGIHSTTRRLVFGPEADYIRHLGPIVAIFDMDRRQRPGSGSMFNLPGRAAMEMCPDTGQMRGLFAFVVDDPAAIDFEDSKSAVARARDAFRGHEIPVVRRLLDGLERADDVFFDSVSQIRLESWHRGRVALVGDSAFAPSFLSGQGTSMALIGGYVLATELVNDPEHPERAFAAYQDKLGEFVERNQAIALRSNTNMLPRDSAKLRKRNLVFWALPWLKRLGLAKLLTRKRGVSDISTSLSIDGYGLA